MRIKVHLRSGSQFETVIAGTPDDLDDDEIGRLLLDELTNQRAQHGFVVLGCTPVHVNAIEAIEPL